MKRLSKVSKQDEKYMTAQVEVGFDPERNKRVIEESIKKYEAMRRKKAQEHGSRIQERASALATYLKSLETGGANSNINSYFSKKEMARLRGQDILDKLKQAEADAKIHRA